MIHDSAQVIFLIGFMGSGKSHDGKLLSEHLGLPFIDLDAWIEEKEGKTISSIFSANGEEYFRLKERDALKEVYEILTQHQRTIQEDRRYKGIVATGGGTPCFFDNIDWMNKRGLTIWFDLPVDVLVERLKKEKSSRPLLAEKTDDELRQFIQEKLQERNSFYKQADIHISEPIAISSLIQKIKDA